MTIINLKDLSFNNIDEVQILDVSAGRDYGRRFRIQIGETQHSQDLVFRDLYRHAECLLKDAKQNVNSFEKYEKVCILVAKLIDANENANIAYKARKDCLYKIRTWFHRLINACQSHESRLEKLQVKVNAKLMQVNFDSILPAGLVSNKLLKQLRQAPEYVQAFIADFIQAHLSLLRQESFEVSELIEAHEQLARCLSENELPGKGVADYILNLHVPNTQWPFLSLIHPADAESPSERLENQIQAAFESSEPGSVEHEWASEGYIRPIQELNLWQKSELILDSPDQWMLHLETRINCPKNKLIESVRYRQIKLDLRAFRTLPDEPLSDEEIRQLRGFLSCDSPCDNRYARLESIKFLDDEKKRTLVEMHNWLCEGVASSVQFLFAR